MEREYLVVARACLFQHLRQPAVVPSAHLRRQSIHHGLPNAVVVGLDVMVVSLGTAQEMGSPQFHESFLRISSDISCPNRFLLTHRLPGHRDNFQDRSRLLREVLHSVPEYPFEGYVAVCTRDVPGTQVVSEFAYEVGITPRLLDD